MIGDGSLSHFRDRGPSPIYMLTFNCVTRIIQLDELYYTCNTVPAGNFVQKGAAAEGGMETETLSGNIRGLQN